MVCGQCALSRRRARHRFARRRSGRLGVDLPRRPATRREQARRGRDSRRRRLRWLHGCLRRQPDLRPADLDRRLDRGDHGPSDGCRSARTARRQDAHPHLRRIQRHRLAVSAIPPRKRKRSSARSSTRSTNASSTSSIRAAPTSPAMTLPGWRRARCTPGLAPANSALSTSSVTSTTRSPGPPRRQASPSAPRCCARAARCSR